MQQPSDKIEEIKIKYPDVDFNRINETIEYLYKYGDGEIKHITNSAYISSYILSQTISDKDKRTYEDVFGGPLKFKYADSVVRDFITVDVLTDSQGYIDFLNKETDDSKISLIISIVIIIALVILAIVLFLIFTPGFLPIFLMILKHGLKIALIVLELIVFIPYLILVLPFQAIHAKRTNTKLKVWNPFKL